MERQIIYIGDPMCSWCWGSAPALKHLRDEFGAVAPMSLMLGGMRAFGTEPMDDARRTAVRKHWDYVNRATGQPFDPASSTGKVSSSTASRHAAPR
ncbi:MAG: hypothetical protein EXQ97_06515 [Alphaproteobacteria bacterium]|nr:hypothetical protein [Alphaproteobacteria bacterium]